MKLQTKISVAVITYNQENTIRQTLDSILAQKGDFDLELVIGEDCSPDGTYAICADYAGRYPDVIKVLPNTKNLGIMANTARVYQAATGAYISLIAGDDYYCDDYALEKQLQYLQSHPKVGVLGANGYQYFVRRNQRKAGFNPVVAAGEDRAKEFFFSPTYKGGIYMWPVGLMVRREVLQYIDFDEMIRRQLPVEDYPMQAIWSQHTQFACMPDLLVTYRVYSSSASFISIENPRYLQYHKGLANIRRYLNELFPNDVCFSEEWLQEYEFYKEFLLNLHQLEYKKAKILIEEVSAKIPDSKKLKQAQRFAKTWLHFVAVHYVKEYQYRKDIKQLT